MVVFLVALLAELLAAQRSRYNQQVTLRSVARFLTQFLPARVARPKGVRMNLTKSLLLASAATLVVVAGAQAADLPTKKGAPAAEYVKVCKVGDIAGFIIPGSDTCLKISGYVNAQIAMGNVSEERQVAYNYGTGENVYITKPAKYVSDIGYYTRGQVNFDAVTNTAMGPLLAHIELQANAGDNRFDSTSGGAVLNAGYVQWAGITAGKHGSFYDYLAGGDTWKDMFSPDHSGTPINLLAYTATFGGGFSATISLEQNESVANVNFPYIYTTYTFVYGASGSPLGVRAPDIVASLDVTQSWGGAHLAAVAHNVRLEYSGEASTDLDTWGYGVIGGVTFNLPMLSAGSKIAFQGAYAHGAIGYSGATSPAWGETDQGFNTNGNGTYFPMADAIYTGDDKTNSWSLSNAWSVAAQLTWKVSPNFEIDPEIAYASVDYGSAAASNWYMSQKATAWWVGAVFDWSPVKNLDFAFDAIYESSHQDTPYEFSTYNPGQAYHNNSDGFNGRIHVVRSF